MKKIKIVLGVILPAALIWYLFVKPYDYLVAFNVRALPGTINQSIKTWNASLQNAKIIESEDLALTQELIFNDSTHIYHWEISPISDTTSRVKVYVRDIDHSLNNKIKIPFSNSEFEDRTRNTLMDFNRKLKDHINSFTVEITGKDELPANYCACTAVSTTQFKKAQGMMHNYPLLSSFLLEHNVSLNGQPFLEVTNWSRETDSLEYHFCFPIILSGELPRHPEIQYKQFSAKNAVKAIYHGNYLTSDRAWYELLDYARKKGIPVTGHAVEVFYNNPNMGGDELRWKTEVYMPIKDDAHE
ncbi:MAG TPA: GyrI-like domain-containing protein [Eudoraea sp.]|nr:GyrI-like domain-containing protein [Eudoraea sp.]